MNIKDWHRKQIVAGQWENDRVVLISSSISQNRKLDAMIYRQSAALDIYVCYQFYSEFHMNRFFGSIFSSFYWLPLLYVLYGIFAQDFIIVVLRGRTDFNGLTIRIARKSTFYSQILVWVLEMLVVPKILLGPWEAYNY